MKKQLDNSDKGKIAGNPSARDGYDNTGTQGYDSLTDDAFTGSSDKPGEHPGEDQSGTGSSSKDFPDREGE